MSKMGDELEKRLDANKYEIWETVIEYHQLLKLLPSIVAIFSKTEVVDHIPYGLTERLWEFIISDNTSQVLAKIGGTNELE